MGGAEVLTYILHPSSPYNQTPVNQKPVIAGVLAYSPLVALHPSSRPYQLTVMLGRLAGKILPWWQRYSPVDASLMSRDKRVAEDWAADELCHDTGTLEGLAGMLDRGLWLEGVADGTQAEIGGRLPPLWFGHGEADRVASFEATRNLALALRARNDVTFCEFEGAFHKLHAELPAVTGEFVRSVVEWVLSRCSPTPTETVKGDDQGTVSQQRTRTKL